MISLRRKSKPDFLQNKTGKDDAKGVWIGGDHPVAVQTMTTTDTADADATLQQIYGLAMEGAEVVRVTVKDADGATSTHSYSLTVNPTPSLGLTLSHQALEPL